MIWYFQCFIPFGPHYISLRLVTLAPISQIENRFVEVKYCSRVTELLGEESVQDPWLHLGWVLSDTCCHPGGRKEILHPSFSPACMLNSGVCLFPCQQRVEHISGMSCLWCEITRQDISRLSPGGRTPIAALWGPGVVFPSRGLEVTVMWEQ